MPSERRAFSMVIAGVVLGLTLSACATDLDVRPHPDPPAPIPTRAEPGIPAAEPVDEPSPLVDSGPREGAMGAIELNANGTPWRYTVVEGDYVVAICQRFNLASEQLVDAGGEPIDWEIFAGEQLRFIPYRPVERP